MDANNCQSGDFVYNFCYETPLEDHDISIRKNYIGEQDCNLPGCQQESHAYIGGFVGVGDFIGGGFPTVSTIGRTGPKKVCQKYIENVATSTCDGKKLPKAYINVVGKVSKAYDKGAKITEWKNCFDSTKYNFIELNPGDRNDGDCDEDVPSRTKAPSSKGTKAPSSKGTKAPKKCPKTTKAPAVPSKGTKVPTVPRKLRRLRY